MSLENNKFKNIINTKKTLSILGELVEAISTPITDDTIRYNSLYLNIKTGMFRYKDIKPIMLSPNRRPFPIVKILMANGGSEVTYEMFAKELKSTDSLKFREEVKSTVRDLRRRLNINAQEHPEDNIFIPTGNGFTLHAK